MQVQKPERLRRSYRQKLEARPERVLPLLCPVRECDWVRGWKPSVVFSHSGLVEQDAIFLTPGNPDAIWIVTHHDPMALRVEMWKIEPEVVATKLEIQLEPREGGCWADVSYEHSALGPRGREILEEFSETNFEEFMRIWEEELNHYLRSGRKLPE